MPTQNTHLTGEVESGPGNLRWPAGHDREHLAAGC